MDEIFCEIFWHFYLLIYLFMFYVLELNLGRIFIVYTKLSLDNDQGCCGVENIWVRVGRINGWMDG